jgi:hypothetical protein
VRKLVAVFALSACAVLARAAEPAAEPSAAEIAAAYAEQRFGGNVVEVWQTDWQGLTLELGVARRWEAGAPEVLLRVLKPHKYEALAFLLKARKDGGPSVTYYRSSKMFPPGRRTGRTLDVVLASQIERLPFVAGLPTLADLWPARASDFTYRRLPDETIENTACRVLESRPVKSDRGYDRIVTAIARDSGVALETRYLKGDRLVRLDRVPVHDVDTSGARAIARRHEISQSGGPPQIVAVGPVTFDPVLPDQLFTSANLRTGRFPSY